MDHLDIEIFLSILKNQSISKASKTLMMSQSSVSQRLKALENELQLELISRKKGIRNVEVTNVGMRFASTCEKWLELYHEIKNYKDTEEILQLTIASTYSLNNYILLPLFNDISRHDKQLRLFIRTQHTAEIFELIDNKKADIGFVFQNVKYKNIVAQTVLVEKMYMICGKCSPWKDRFVKPTDLDPSDELRITWCPSVVQWHDFWWNPSIRPYIQLDSPYLIPDLINQPGRWAICPESVIKTFTFEDHIEIHEFTEAPPPRECFMIFHRYPSEHQEKAITIFRQYFNTFLSKLSFRA